jgi:hypothetical protein
VCAPLRVLVRVRACVCTSIGFSRVSIPRTAHWLISGFTPAQNYYATRYSAEIVNTLTNVLFISLAFKGIYNCLKNGHDRIFLITFVGYLVVGSGSFAFHATLKCTYSTAHILFDTVPVD